MHLFADPDGRLLGQNTRKTFEHVLDLVLARSWPADGILLTGDMVHDETREGYRWLAERLGEFSVPCHCLPGNHDSLDAIADTLTSSSVGFAASATFGEWHIVMLDTSIAGRDGGHLSPDQLEALEFELRRHQDEHTLVCLHHQPVPVGSAWLDTMAVDNAVEFFSTLDRHAQVRGVLWGHVHQEFRSFRNNVLLLATPSTCIQFRRGSREFALDEVTPGYRWLELHPDGRIATGVERIAAYPEPLDLRSLGY
jgi:Icc protein